MKRTWTWTILVVVLSACSRMPEVAVVPPPPPPPPGVPARDIVVTGEPTDPRFGAYAYVVFTSPLTGTSAWTDKRLRYQTFCRAYLEGLNDVSDLPSLNPKDLLVTYWMLRSGTTAGEDCRVLVNNYDYGMAAALAAGANKSGANGPLIVALTRPFEPGQTVSGPRIVMDLSKLSPETFNHVVTEWRARLVLDPAKWNTGFKLADTRLALHSLLAAYGKDILEVVQPDD